MGLAATLTADMPPPSLENNALTGTEPRSDTENDTAKTLLIPHSLRPLEGAPGYFLGERFAAGGMGTVHFGLKRGALGFQRVVAIKQMHLHLVQSPEFVARFKHEIRVVSRLSHPNIVDTLDVIEAQGELSLVMEYVDGDTLYDLLKEARKSGSLLAIPAVVGILSQALYGLHAAHEASDDEGNRLNLIHRDVSPQNIMIGKDGVVKILDFGVAKARSEQSVTYVGEVLGKVAYMSPEQALARPLDRRSDIFAAGIVLWEALSGQRLFRAPDSSGLGPLLNVLQTRVRPPSELREGVSPELDAIVLRALAHDPSKRFGSARDFALALEQAVAGASASVIASTLSAVCGERGLRRTQLLAALRAGLVRSTCQAGDVTERGPALDSHPCAPDGPGSAAGTTAATLERADDPDLRTRDFKDVFVMSAGTPPMRRGHRSLVWALLSLTALSFLCVLAARSAVDTDAGVTRSAALLPTQAVPMPEVAPAARHSEKAVQGVKLQTSEATDTASEAARVVGPSRQRSRGLVAKGKRTRPTSTRATSSVQVEANCSTPTYVDAEGIRHFKPECL
jgi:serine/threonine-protein kinase